ncbi:ABC transporter ATP-binding protein [bacterium endosymbiont of Pedicinus badii]|uniref:ABC transporter ATP-binding protein n=1 Tax=bacterium endosymbiont of Pedicinus badii TaxID=1719126 RepID=UPI0009BAA2BE|nr:ABC transporter ATP-binding protein [bacterium endosymbiont of Pedicinus badii]OQM34374.1 hypothetical protein AOQ89_00580 [bacterium endosymbiont of Pedicinus badii]
MSKKKLLICKNLVKKYKNSKILALSKINLELDYGEILVISGKSGSGKSTLLSLIAKFEEPTLGNIYFKGILLKKISDKNMSILRNRNIGFIHQFHYLLSDFSILENVMLPSLIYGNKIKESEKKAKVLLKKFGLYEKIHFFPGELSGGENQRVAIARAIVNHPDLILADEPTGNLDKENTEIVIEIFKKINREYKTSIIIVTHDKKIINTFKKNIVIKK